jgi:hypothetical protein
MAFCADCGAAEQNGKFCSRCGAGIPEVLGASSKRNTGEGKPAHEQAPTNDSVPSSLPVSPNQGSKPVNRVALIALIVLIVAALVILIATNQKSTSSSTGTLDSSSSDSSSSDSASTDAAAPVDESPAPDTSGTETAMTDAVANSWYLSSSTCSTNRDPAENLYTFWERWDGNVGIISLMRNDDNSDWSGVTFRVKDNGTKWSISQSTDSPVADDPFAFTGTPSYSCDPWTVKK